jgi:predicted site-specific integrase-resolvase
MKLTDWAKVQGVCYMSAWNYFHAGQIEGAFRLPSGAIIVPDPIPVKPAKKECIVTYARVSSSENKNNKNNLATQSKRLIDFCNAKGWQTNNNIKEIGSGLNDKRRKLENVLKEGNVTKLIVEHKDRLCRFGFNYIKILCEKINCELIVINETESEKEDLIQDFVSVITSFCARIYGQRRSRRRTEKLIKELEEIK